MRAVCVLALMALVLSPVRAHAILDFSRGPAAEGNEAFAAGDYEKALNKYGEALVDEPDSPRLNFNMGDAHYKLGNYEEAVASFARVRATGEADERFAKVAYNVGNAQFRLAEALETEEPQKALEAYALALAAYRRSLGAEHGDDDAKFNYEYTLKRMQELKEWLEQQQQEQQEQNPEDQEQPEPEEQEQGDQQQQPQEQQAQEQQQDPQEQAEGGDEEEQRESQGEQGDAAEQESDQGEEMNRREASALVDMARDEELRPEDFVRQMHGGNVAVPARDW